MYQNCYYTCTSFYTRHSFPHPTRRGNFNPKRHILRFRVLKSFDYLFTNRQRMFDIIELNEKKVSLIDYSDFTIIKTKKNIKFPIHDDTFNKLLSGVVYLYPEKNIGTIFYNTKSGKDKNIVEWKINRAVFFSRIERETWHSYGADSANDRITLIFNLMTKEKNLKKILDIEKKNYFFGKLRYKINPYLYRLFNNTI